MKNLIRFVTIAACLSLAACAAEPVDGEENTDETTVKTGTEAPVEPPSDPTTSDEHVGENKEELKWNPPLCSYFRWQCGGCICDACNVVDCRGATVSTSAKVAP